MQRIFFLNLSPLWIHRLQWLALILLFLGGPLMGWLSWRISSQFEQNKIQRLFGQYLAEQSATLQKDTQVIMEELYHFRSSFHLHQPFTRQNFLLLAEDTLAEHPAIYAIGWLPRIVADQREIHEKQAQREGLTGYQVLIRDPKKGMIPSPPKPEYYPVYFVEPLQVNRLALGFDIASEKCRRTALQRAIQTGRFTLAGPVDLIQDAAASKGFLLMLPVFRPASPPKTDHAEVPEGIFLLVLRIQEIFRDFLKGSLGHAATWMNYQLVDEDAENGPRLIASTSEGKPSSTAPESAFFQWIEFADHRWRLTAQPSESFLTEHQSRHPLAMGVLAFLLWEGLSGLLIAVWKNSKIAVERKEHRILHGIIQSLTEGVIVADRQGKLLLFNEKAEAILGIRTTPTDMTEWALAHHCYQDDGKTPFAPDQLPLIRTIRGEEVRDVEVFVRRPEAPQGIWISVNGAPLLDDLGVCAGGIVAFRDISSRKMAEEQQHRLLKQLEEMKFALDQAAIVSITDAQGTILYTNQKFCEISRYPQEELLGRNPRLLHSGYHSQEFFQELWMTIGAGQVWKNEIRNRSKQGDFFWVDTTIVPSLDDNSVPVRYLSIQIDITARKAQEETLQRLSNAVEQTADIIFITNQDGIIEYVNPAVESITGYSQQEILGQTPRILKSGFYEAKHYESMWHLIKSGEVFRDTFINRKKNGDFFHAEQTITPMKDTQGKITHFVSVIKDVTERLQKEEQDIEMRYASRVQKKLYPQTPPHIDGLDIAGAVFPAVATCGDYYDFFPMTDNIHGIAIGDVCGHGLGPALIMASIRAYLRSLSQSALSADSIFQSINRSLHQDLPDNSFVTLLLTCIDSTGKKLIYTSAGHTPGYQLAKDGTVKAVLQATGPPLGLFADTCYQCSAKLDLESGDMIVMLTDGITEYSSPDGSFFEAFRALEVVRAYRQESAERIVRQLYQAVCDYSQGVVQQDDVTMVICKVL